MNEFGLIASGLVLGIKPRASQTTLRYLLSSPNASLRISDKSFHSICKITTPIRKEEERKNPKRKSAKAGKEKPSCEDKTSHSPDRDIHISRAYPAIRPTAVGVRWPSSDLGGSQQHLPADLLTNAADFFLPNSCELLSDFPPIGNCWWVVAHSKVKLDLQTMRPLHRPLDQ